MVQQQVELEFAKLQDERFGFRLVGGADFEVPLSVSLVGEGSIAERCGMKVGDVVIRINGTNVTSLPHQDAHDLLMKAGCNFTLSVQREVAPAPAVEVPKSPSPAPIRTCPIQRPFTPQEIQILHDNGISDEQIAEIMSGESEVLKSHNVLGINFNKMMPKAGVFKHSEVFNVLNEEQQKTAEDIQKEQQKWTTFLQKPNRPIPKPKKRTPTPEPKTKSAPSPVPQAASPSPIQTPAPVQEELARPPTPRPTTPVPEIKVETAAPAEQRPQQEEPLLEPIPESKIEVTEAKPEDIDEEQFATQLKTVKAQLESLSSLPTTIQATLDAITQQLQQLIPPPKPPKAPTPPKEEVKEQPAEPEPEPQPPQKETTPEPYLPPTPDGAEHPQPRLAEDIARINQELDFRADDWDSKFDTDPEMQRQKLQEELKQQLKQQKKPKQRSKRAFHPLTPRERPIFLRGRMWKSPKDAYNEDFIAEIISSQAELIKEGTLGSAYESPILEYDERVNFLKYHKPEKDLSFLKSSETYKLIHGLDEHPVSGIENRPPIVAAEEDILRVRRGSACWRFKTSTFVPPQ